MRRYLPDWINVHLFVVLGIILPFLWAARLDAQTPLPVTPGYQICNTNDPGNTRCAWQPVDAAHPLPSGALGITPLSPGQYTPVSDASSTALTAPAGSTYAVVTVEVSSHRFTVDGTTTPTTTIGTLIGAGAPVVLTSALQIANFRIITVSAGGVFTVSYGK